VSPVVGGPHLAAGGLINVLLPTRRAGQPGRALLNPRKSAAQVALHVGLAATAGAERRALAIVAAVENRGPHLGDQNPPSRARRLLVLDAEGVHVGVGVVDPGLGLIGEQRGAGASGWQYHLPDALGSVRQTADATGAVTLRRGYDPFGSLRTTEGIGSAYGFAGEEQEAGSGNVYLRARTYHPATGRFLQPDSLLGTPARPQTLHRYAYAFNNPANVVDPSGHMPPGRSANSPASALSSAGTGPLGAPGRSANSAGWSTFSDPVARQQSRGHEPFYCDALRFFNEALREVDRLLTALDPLQDAIYDRLREHLDRLPLEKVNRYLEGQGDLLLGLSPADVVYDLVSLALGRDLLSGRELSHLEEGLILFGFVTGGFGDDLGKLGLRALSVTDEVVQAGRRALLRSSDELALAGRRLMRAGSEVVDNIPGVRRFARRYAGESLGVGRYVDTGATLVDDTKLARRRVLVLGESDTFEYSIELARKRKDLDIIATRYKQGTPLPKEIPGNLRFMDEVDATNLHKDPRFADEQFDMIIFNNPERGATRGKSWRENSGELVQQTFQSIERRPSILRANSELRFSSTPRGPATNALREYASTGTRTVRNELLHTLDRRFVPLEVTDYINLWCQFRG
jgi:RHS repeat-associated protein